MIVNWHDKLVFLVLKNMDITPEHCKSPEDIILYARIYRLIFFVLIICYNFTALIISFIIHLIFK